MALLTGCKDSKNVELTLTIGEATFDFKSKVQNLYDAGFVICDTAYGKITPEEDLPNLEARIVDTVSSYYVGKPVSETEAEFTGVVIYVYNPSGSECSFKEASIFKYTYQYEPGFESDTTVLFNDVSFENLNHEEGVAAMEGMGITFHEDEKAEFLDKATNDGYGWPLLTSSNKYKYYISRNKDANGDLYVDEMYFEKTLDVEYK